MPQQKQQVDFDINNTPWKKLKNSLNVRQIKEDLILQHLKNEKKNHIIEGQCLCGQYIRARLKRSGMLNRKVVQRLRIIIDTPTTNAIRDVFPILNTMGEELERMHPRIYTNISRQISRTPFGELQEAHTAPILLHTAAKELFRNGINWAKIISLFAISGGLAVDIVRQGHYDYLQRLIEGTADIIEDDLLPWLIENGGWLGLLDYIRPSQTKISYMGWLTIFVAIMFIFYVITCTFKFIGSNFYTFVM